jgi:hypothetical protein
MMMRSFSDELRSDVEAFLARTGLKPTKLGRLAANDAHIVSRLRTGLGITIRRADQLRDFMAKFEADQAKARSAAKSDRPPNKAA